MTSIAGCNDFHKPGAEPLNLRDLPQWVSWRYQHIPGKPKPKKPPVDPKTGEPASPTDPATWGTYAQARAYTQNAGADGVGLVLTESLGLTLVDLDDCIDDASAVASWALAIVDRLASYTEYSPSGRGLHILVWGRVEALKTPRVELYSVARYTTITGRPYGPRRPIRHAQTTLDAIRAEHAPAPPTSGKPQTYAQPIDASDADVIALLCSNPKQAARWAGQVTGNRSSHLYGLINGLIWLCGPDQARIERLVRQSGLYDPKRHDLNSGGGRSNLSVSVYNAINSWRGAPYNWGARGQQKTPVETALAVNPPTPAPDPTFTECMEALRLQLRYGVFFGRTADTDLAVTDALIDLAIDRQRADGLAVGLERLRDMTGLGSTSTVRAALERLAWLVTRTGNGDRVTRADVYEFNNDIFCSKSHVNSKSGKDMMRFGTKNNLYSTWRNADAFSTGGGGAGRALGNNERGAGKLLALLIDVLHRAGLSMTGADLVGLTGRPYQSVSRALARGYALRMLERHRDGGRGRGRPVYRYSVPVDVEQRMAAAAVGMRSCGVGLDRAANGALGLHMHANRLLNNDAESKRPLDDAQRKLLRLWSAVGDVEFRALSEIADAAQKIDPHAVKEKIAGACGAVHSSRAINAAREFRSSIQSVDGLARVLAGKLAALGEVINDKRRAQLAKDAARIELKLFQRWANLNGYFDLAQRGARQTVKNALRIARIVRQAAAPVHKPMTWTEIKAVEQAAAYKARFGVEFRAGVEA